MIKSKMLDAWDVVSARFELDESALLPLTMVGTILVLIVVELTGVI